MATSFSRLDIWIFSWGYVKSPVYTTPVETVEDLTAKIFNTCEVVQHIRHFETSSTKHDATVPALK